MCVVSGASCASPTADLSGMISMRSDIGDAAPAAIVHAITSARAHHDASDGGHQWPCTRHADGAQVWRSGGGRRLVLAFAFLILLPFYASLGPMLYQRISRGLIGDTVALGVLGLVFTALMGLLLQQLIHAVRTRVAVDDSRHQADCPDGRANRGPFVSLRYADRDIAHANVAAVETRCEVYGGSLAAGAAQVDPRYHQGRASKSCSASPTPMTPTISSPFPTIGAEIARTGRRRGARSRRRAPVAHEPHAGRRERRDTQHAVVHRRGRADQPGASAQFARARRRARRLLVAGIGIDVATSYKTDFVGMGAGVSEPAPAPKKR